PAAQAPGMADPPALDPVGRQLASCLGEAITYVVESARRRCWNSHCSRCRKARAAAYASNLFTPADGLRFTRGEDHLVTYKVPEARFFRPLFCRSCGSPMPRIDRERGFAVVPMGALDDDPGMRPER